MSEINLEPLVNQLSELSVLQIAQLTKLLEDKWGVKAAPMMAAAPVAAAAAGESAAQQTEFTVVLQETGANKLNVIKVLKDLLGLGLKEAKDLADGAPKPVKAGVSKEEADSLRKKLEEAGAKIEVK